MSTRKPRPSGRDELFEWIEQARDTFQQLGVTAVNPERFLTEVATKLRQVFAADDEELLTLAQAAARSELSEDHLGRLIREGKIPNAGRRGAPRIRATDLPRRARRAFATTPHVAYDPVTDARALRSRRGGRA